MKFLFLTIISITCFAQEIDLNERIEVSPIEISNVLLKEEKNVDSFTNSNLKKAQKNKNVSFCIDHKSLFGTYSFCQKKDKNIRELVYKKHNDNKNFIIKRANIIPVMEFEPIEPEKEEYL